MTIPVHVYLDYNYLKISMYILRLAFYYKQIKYSETANAKNYQN